MRFPRLLPSYSFLLALVALLLLGGCQITAPLRMPPASAPPLLFRGGAAADSTARADSVSVADIQWADFFADSILVELVDTALQQNLDLRTTVQRIEVARADLRYARGALLPTVDGVASAGLDRYGKYTQNGVGNYDTNFSPNVEGARRIPYSVTPDYFLGLRSSWEIDLWGKLRNRRRAAYGRLLASEQGVRAVVTELVAQVATRYYELLAFDNERDVLLRNIKLQEQALEIIKIQKLGGRATELAVQQFRAQLLRTQGLEAEVQQRIVETENQLNFLLGRYPGPVRRGIPLRDQRVPAAVSAGLPARLLQRRPDIRQAELLLQATRADVAAARAAFFPSFTLTPYVGFNAFRAAQLFDPGSLAFGFLGNLTAPLLNRNALRAAYGRATAESIIAYYTYQRTIQRGFQEVTTSLRGIANYNRVFSLKQQEVEALSSAVSISNDLFLANYATYLEVITAQRNVLEAELTLTNTRRTQFLLLIDLYRALGGGWQSAAQ